MAKTILAIFVGSFLMVTVSALAIAQTTQKAPAMPIQTSNDPGYNHGKGGGINSYPSPSAIKYMIAKEPQDRRIDMFMGDWRESMPRSILGSLVLRDLLTKGDNFAPPQKAAILQYENYLAHATLPAHASTTPTRLTGEQHIYYVIGGTGTMTAGGATGQLHKDIATFMPANLEFVIKNNGDQPLVMYLISEPTPPGFKPHHEMLMIDERAAHFRTPAGPDPYITPGASGHWAHVVRELFAERDGLATVSSILTVELQPISLGEPHPHGPLQEELWTALEGTSLAWEGAELRLQHPGMAYMIRPDGTSTHTNINFGDTTVKFLYSVAGPWKQ